MLLLLFFPSLYIQITVLSKKCRINPPLSISFIPKIQAVSISVYIATKPDWAMLITTLLCEAYGLDESFSEQIYIENVKPHFESLKDEICLLAETSYVDGFYRDSYYHYFSSKLNCYSRDCIRISLFDGEVSEEDFADPDKYDVLQGKYRGFYVLRPTFPLVIGRSVISPEALKDSEMRLCVSDFNTTANGLKLRVCGFPHSSQDTETITCAETTLWAIMEYFGNKYAYYKPVQPSKIIKQLNDLSYERQVPSRGLAVHQISYALKEFGFGTRMYGKDQYGDEFERLLSCYVESGIPLVIAIQNEVAGIGHALLAVGRENDYSTRFDELEPCNIDDEKCLLAMALNDIEIYDYDSMPKRFVFIDDNHPVYQKATLAKPAEHYPSDDWRKCTITHFIAPLYPKIYLEAFQAKKYVIQFLLTGPQPIREHSEIVLRVFLASSRSYKHELARNNGVSGELKNLLIETQMSKFIWVAEISTKELIKAGKASGLMIVDATEANVYHKVNPLIMAVFDGNLLVLEKSSGKLQKKVLHSEPFSIYDHNLKAFDK